MNAWEELLAATRPGREVENGADCWLILRRSCNNDEPFGRYDRMTITVELVRSGSPTDPRRLPDDAPRPTSRKDT